MFGALAASSLNLSLDSPSSAYRGPTLKMTITSWPSTPSSARSPTSSLSCGGRLRCILRPRESSLTVNLGELARGRSRLCWSRRPWRRCLTRQARISMTKKPTGLRGLFDGFCSMMLPRDRRRRKSYSIHGSERLASRVSRPRRPQSSQSSWRGSSAWRVWYSAGGPSLVSHPMVVIMGKQVLCHTRRGPNAGSW